MNLTDKFLFKFSHLDEVTILVFRMDFILWLEMCR